MKHISEAPLKPRQKMEVLQNHLIPKFVHTLVLGRTAKVVVDAMDRSIRSAVVKWLRLPSDTPIAGLHAPIRLGGLGVPCLRDRVQLGKLSRFKGLQGASDDRVKAVVGSEFVKYWLGKTWLRQVTRRGIAVKYQYELAEKFDTKGLQGIEKVPAVNRWLFQQVKDEKGYEYPELCKARLGVYPTAVRQSRGGRVVNTACRCQTGKTANAQHIIQGCPLTHGVRVKRHDNIVGFLASTLKGEGVKVHKELRLHTEDGLRKPDIVVVSAGGIKVIDVQVVADAAVADLEFCHRQKVAKYNVDAVKSKLKEQFGDLSVSFYAVTLNWRGVFSAESAKRCRMAGILTGSRIGAISYMCLRDTTKIMLTYDRSTHTR